MNIFTPPASKYIDTINNYKFNLSWKVFLFSASAFGLLSIFHITYNNDNLIKAFTAFLVTTLCLVSLKFTRKYNVTVAIISVSGFFINQYTIYSMMNIDRFVDVLWILSVGFYVFYMVGVFWGMINLLVNFTGLFIFIIQTPKEILEHNIANKTFTNEVDMTVNAFVSLALITYLLHRLLTEHKTSIKSLEQSNKELQNQKNILEKQNDEKTVLLQEVHHRVKNNLQIISSLLRLQAGELEDSELKDRFEEANNRVRSMALIHEKIYQNKNLANLNLKDYLSALTKELVDTYAFNKNISIEINTSKINQIDIKTLVPLALIFNELIANSLKHGFKDKNQGSIEIDFKIENSRTIIFYYDNGTWMQKQDENGFGTILIETFTEQLDGNYELSTEKGTTYKFDLENIEEHSTT